jgi:hypothetical protein
MSKLLEKYLGTAADDSDVIDSLPVTAAVIGVALSTLKLEIARGARPEVVQLTERRQGVTRGARRKWVASRTVKPGALDDRAA